MADGLVREMFHLFSITDLGTIRQKAERYVRQNNEPVIVHHHANLRPCNTHCLRYSPVDYDDNVAINKLMDEQDNND